MINDLFPYIGEAILQKLSTDQPEIIMEMVGLSAHSFVSIHQNVPFVFPNSSVMFDGFSSIDLCLKLDDNTIFPIEVKLGSTGLQRATINKKLKSCSLSDHKNESRIKGNTLSVLNRYFDQDLYSMVKNDKLHAIIDVVNLKLRTEWGIIARDHILKSWQQFPPNFNGMQRFVSLESLCSRFGKTAFNQTAKSMFHNINFYNVWVETDS